MPRYSPNTGLPKILARKIYKTGQTRGAEVDEIYQNRVARCSTVLVPLSIWPQVSDRDFENGCIVIAQPNEYFSEHPPEPRSEIPADLTLGVHLLIYYRTRDDWSRFNPASFRWSYATSRRPPLGGNYIARVPGTTAKDTARVFEGFTEGDVGAGIRVYEYASSETIEQTRYQLSYLAWNAEGMVDLAKEHGEKHPEDHRRHVEEYCRARNLADPQLLAEKRLMIGGRTVCPLCLEAISAHDLTTRISQAQGRETPDLTVTIASLFHLEELRPGHFNHRIYNLGWGHYYCNTVIADKGIGTTIHWMREVLSRNEGYDVARKEQGPGA